MANSPIRAASPYDPIIAATIQYERVPQFKLRAQKDAVEVSRAILKDFDSNLSALNTLLKSFTDPFSTPFASRKATGGSDAYTLSASDKTPPGGHTLEIHRLAASDTRLSKQMTRTGTDLRTFFDANGAQTFSIGVASPTSADPNNRVDVSVSVNPSGATDQEILDEIRTAITSAMTSAADSDLISRAQRPSASLLNETSTTSRLSLRSAETGYQGRLSFTDSGNGLLALLELDTNAVHAGTGGGQVYAVGTDETSSDLTATFTLDGVKMYRSANSVADALPGLTLQLNKTTAAPTTFTVQADTETTEKKVKDFIAKYNDVMKFLDTKTRVDGTTGERGSLAGDSAIVGLRSRFRTSIASRVDGQPAGFSSLQDLGISISRDGTLELSDVSKLQKASERDPAALARLFDSEDGLANRLQKQVASYVGSDGLIKRRETSMDSQMKQLDRKISDWDVRMERRETQLRTEYGRLQETLARLQTQQASFLSFYSGF